jgi:hypothetical protein
MTDSHNAGAHAGGASSASGTRRTSLAQLGGGLGIAGALLGFAIFFSACAGFSAVFILSPLPIILGAVGLVLAVVGGVTQQDLHIPDPAVLAAVFLSVFAIVGGLLLMAAWLGWQIFPK